LDEKNNISTKISSILVATKADISIPTSENKSVINNKTYSTKEYSNNFRQVLSEIRKRGSLGSAIDVTGLKVCLNQSHIISPYIAEIGSSFFHCTLEDAGCNQSVSNQASMSKSRRL
jgi:hypothetical protein